MRQPSIVLATRNPGKVREIRQALADLPIEILDLASSGTIPEPAEDGATFADNARTKALYYARATGKWALAEDSGLAVDALDGAPGVRSARYASGDCAPEADRSAIDLANNARLLGALEGVPDAQRTARFVCHLVLADAESVLIETFDTLEGQIARSPTGENGFGYDPIFYVPAHGRTTAQLSTEQKNRISHRGKAVRHFAGLLRTFLYRAH